MKTSFKEPVWISVEGLDGVGKTTFAKQLYESLSSRYTVRIVKLAPPEGKTLGEKIVNSIKNELQFVNNIYNQRIEYIINDRGPLTTAAYNLALCNYSTYWENVILKHYETIQKPDITYYLETPVSVAMKRLQKRDRLSEKVLQKEERQFLKVRAYFEKLLALQLQVTFRRRG